MADAWVRRVQEWLNSTYRGVNGVGPVTVNGNTGWSTMYALTRALQHELGISSLSNNFGPGTRGAVARIGDIGPGTTASGVNMSRVNNIIRGGLFCKGYNGGDGELDGTYSALTVRAVTNLRRHIGLSDGNGTISPKVFKALLTMDAYELLEGGSATVRSIQQDFNARYLHREDFFVIPADGILSRDVQNALKLAVQYELGMADGVATGTFGPGTKRGIREQAHLRQGTTDTSKYFVHLFQAALNFNGYPTVYDGNFSPSLKTAIQEFQRFCVLPVTGEADFQTWASLMVSTGDTDRPGTAVDCVTTITPERARTLIAHGYRTVGRYLTNSPVADPLDKNIKPGELATIFTNGLTVFPIFQEGGDGVEYFNHAKGLYAGRKADAVARGYGFKRGTTIYFAVDFDATEDEVYSNVVPYFQGINDSIATVDSQYQVGIYGSRNTCSIVSRKGLATLSFVGGMSTGYSGNLGFPLPKNWAFDQILEYSIGTGAGAIGIDKDIMSGRDAGQNSVDIIQPSGAGLLDVRLRSQDALRSRLETFLDSQIPLVQKIIVSRSPSAAVNLVFKYDELVTNLARKYGMRKALIQTVFLWEAAVVSVADIAADLLVERHYKHVLFGELEPLVKHEDSSTGPCQIFAKTAIEAITWARGRGLTDLPHRRVEDKRDMFEIWTQLKDDETFNISLAALVLLHGAGKEHLGTNYLEYSAAETIQALASYNNSDSWGAERYLLYEIFEESNQAARMLNNSL